MMPILMIEILIFCGVWWVLAKVISWPLRWLGMTRLPAQFIGGCVSFVCVMVWITVQLLAH